MSLKTVAFNKGDLIISKKSTGRWGAFSYDLEAKERKNGRYYLRSYKSLALSNMLFDYARMENSEKIFVNFSNANNLSSKLRPLYFIGDKKLNSINKLLNTISYVVANQTLIIAFPLILTLFLCNEEYKKDYEFKNSLHKQLTRLSKLITMILFLLIALY